MNFVILYDEISAELEREYQWRFEELNFLQNIESNINDEEQRRKYRKSLIVMLYSHFEGFCKFAFAYYIASINNQRYVRSSLSPSLIAASMNKEFIAYDNLDIKCNIFRKSLPDDSKLHRFSRRRDFVCAFDNFLENTAEIPDNVVDTESNLTPTILKKILFRLDFDTSIADRFKDQINRLLEYRNHIAHGKASDGIDEKDYSDIKVSICLVIKDIKELIAHALRDEVYLAKAHHNQAV